MLKCFWEKNMEKDKIDFDKARGIVMHILLGSTEKIKHDNLLRICSNLCKRKKIILSEDIMQQVIDSVLQYFAKNNLLVGDKYEGYFIRMSYIPQELHLDRLQNNLENPPKSDNQM